MNIWLILKEAIIPLNKKFSVWVFLGLVASCKAKLKVGIL